MEAGGRPGEVRIGAALAEGRARAGLELDEVEQRTKIRARYLRALEEERWAELPSSAYAKGFLRTYAGVLDLDAELLVDEYRRQVEARTDEAQEPRRATPLTVALAAIATVAAVVAVIAVTRDEDEDGEPASRAGKTGKEKERDREPQSSSSGELVRLELHVRQAVEVCLLGSGREELIDGQLLSAGSRDAFASESFQLRFPAGFNREQVDLELNGERAKLPRIEGPAKLKITPPSRVRQASPPGESCP